MAQYIASSELRVVLEEFPYSNIDLENQRLDLVCPTNDGNQFYCYVYFDSIKNNGLAIAIMKEILKNSGEKWYNDIHSKMERTLDKLEKLG